MKKSILTLSLVALFAVAGKAQAKATSNQEPIKKKETTKKSEEAVTVNPDGTVSSSTKDKSQDNATPTPAKKSGTRMAISEKGTPTKTTKQPAKETKDEKQTQLSQPGSSKKE